MRSDENVSAVRESYTRGRCREKRAKGLVAVIGDSRTSASEAAACAAPANVRTVQVTGDVGSQRLTSSVGARQEEKNEVAVVAPGIGG